eukprot:scaffold2238_cov145-Skeletonema_menzelii.AAC.8
MVVSESTEQASNCSAGDSNQNNQMVMMINNNDDEEEQLYTSIEEQDERRYQHQHKEWNPDAITYVRAAIAMSPFMSYLCYKMQLVAIPYLALQMLSIPLALKLRDHSGCIRWPSAFVFVALLGGIKTSSVLMKFGNDNVAVKGMFYAFTAFWECSNAVHIFGGRDSMDRFGIINYQRAFFAALCPAQIKFTAQVFPRDRWVRALLHIGGYLATFAALRLVLRYVAETIEMYAVLEAEANVICISCLVHIWNFPPLLYQMFMTGYRVKVIYPFGSIYLSTSSREFWSKWSRPGSSLIRHMFYYPLGGKGRAFLSIPLMFLLNASSHYSVSEALVGDKSELGWNVVFGALGLAATIEVYCDSFFEGINTDDGTRSTNKWWTRVRFVLASASLRFAAYTLLHKCLNSSLHSLLGLQ